MATVKWRITMYMIKKQVADHLREHATIYLFMIILFLTGIIFGAIIVNSMDFIQKQDLFFYLERYFGQISTDDSIENKTILMGSFLYHMKYLLLLFVLGLTVIGLPIVWILLFVKGLVVGFSVGFIVNQLGVKGLFFAALSIAPQNFLVIPTYVIAGSLSMIFSLTLFTILFNRQVSRPIFHLFSRYVFVFLILITVSSMAAILEAFVAHEAMQSFIRSFY